jgi:hypothetical protein
MACAMLVGLGAAPGVQPEAPTIGERWGERLGALTPDDPEAYFLLGEEVADVAVEQDEIELARHLFVVAFELDRTSAWGSGLGSSICLALASIERLDSRRAWLRALAGAIDPRYSAQEWFQSGAAPVDSETALLVATLLGQVRAGDGAQAKRLLNDPKVRAVLEDYESLLGNTGLSGGLGRLESYVSAWPCPECGNERIVSLAGTDPVRYRLCFTCEGNPGPKMEQAELISYLRFESRLLSGLQRSWAAQVASDLGEPLRDPSPADLSYVLNENATLVYWRDGTWTASPDEE